MGLADGIAVIALGMAVNEPEQKAFAEWRDGQQGGQGGQGGVEGFGYTQP